MDENLEGSLEREGNFSEEDPDFGNFKRIIRIGGYDLDINCLPNRKTEGNTAEYRNLQLK